MKWIVISSLHTLMKGWMETPLLCVLWRVGGHVSRGLSSRSPEPPVSWGRASGRDWRPGRRQGAGPHRDLLGSKGLEGHPGVLLGEPTESWAVEKHLLSLEDLHRTNSKKHPTHDNIQLDPLTCLLPLCFMNQYNTTVVPYMHTINTRTKITEVADDTNPQQVCTYL